MEVEMVMQRRTTDPEPQQARANARAEIPRAAFRGVAVADAGHDAAVMAACSSFDSRAVRLWGPR